MWARERQSHPKWLGFQAQITRIYRHTCGQRNPAYETRPLAVCKSPRIGSAMSDAFLGVVGFRGAEENKKEQRKTPTRIPTKPVASKTKPVKSHLSTTTTTRHKKTKETPKSPEVERSPAPSVETPTPKEISTDKGRPRTCVHLFLS